MLRRHLLPRAAALLAALSLAGAGPLLAQRQSAPLAPVRPAFDSADVCRGPCEPKRVWIAIGETFLINAFVLAANKIVRPENEGFHIGLQSWKSNLQLGWNWDDNTFQTNMIAHPIHGSLYFNAARSNGMSYWEALPLPFLGSWEWEYLGETHRPALNDFFNTAFGGIALGEMSHRAASLVRDNRATGSTRVWNEIWGTLLDPMGGFNRFVNGRMNDLGPNPQEHFPSALGLTLQTGARVVGDSTGSADNPEGALTGILDLSYGDPFVTYKTPWDAFHVRAQLSLGDNLAGGGLNLLRAVGRVYGSEFTATDASNRHQFVIWQMYDYVRNPGYVFGSQSFGFGLMSRWRANAPWSVGTSASVQLVPISAVQTDSATANGRAYDFGPGAGLAFAANVRHRGVVAPIASLGYRLDYIHAVSGSDADHYLQVFSAEAEVPVRAGFGIGAAYNYYMRDSKFVTRAAEFARFPEFRAYVTWNLDYRPAPVEAR